MKKTWPEEHDSKIFLVAVAVAVAVIVAYFALGMPGMNHGTGSVDSVGSMDSMAMQTGETMPAVQPDQQAKQADRTIPVKMPAKALPKETDAAVSELVDPSVFETRMKAGGVLLNVHNPYEGEIASTSLSIKFDEISANAKELPTDLDTPLLVYCRSGRMSAIATKELAHLGYRNVSDLRGGMLAWVASGRSIVTSSGSVSLP